MSHSLQELKAMLRACPFCGSNDGPEVDGDGYGPNDEGTWYVRCAVCGAQGPDLTTYPIDAVNEWNRRRRPMKKTYNCNEEGRQLSVKLVKGSSAKIPSLTKTTSATS